MGNSACKEQIFRFGELFCGPGGLSHGVLSAQIRYRGVHYKIEHAWASDYDSNSCQTYRNNICPQHPERVIESDVHKLNIENLSPIEGLAFGFPCNDFSTVGEQKGINGRFGALYNFGVRVLEQHHPLWFIAENVSGIRSANEGTAFKKILADLESAGFGYELTPHLYRFEDYEVPQTRHRVLIVGIRSDVGLRFRVPSPTTPEYKKTAYDALYNPPIPESASNHEMTKQSIQVIERLMHIPAGSNAWHDKLPMHLRLNVDGLRMSQIYRRLDPYKPSYTITGSGGGGTHVYHWSEPRALTNRERARIQTFPDEFVFWGNKESVRKQIGMAVPPHAAELIATALLKTFAGEKYDYVPENIPFSSKLAQLSIGGIVNE